MKTLALVYEHPPEQVFINAASLAGITAEQAKSAYGVLLADSAPTVVDDREPDVLALNARAVKTMLALEGRPQQGSAIDTRWFGIRHEQPDRGPRNGGFLGDRLY